MAHQVIASVVITLSDEPEEMANRLGSIATAWSEFLARTGRPDESQFAVNETRAKATGAKRGRKPRVVAEQERDAA